MPLTSPQPTRGLPVADLVGTLGTGLLTVAVDAPGSEVDDIAVAEPAHGVFGQPGDLLLGVGVEAPGAAVDLLAEAAARRVGAVLLRRPAARNRTVRAAARRHRLTLVELADTASWAHLIVLLRGVLDRATDPDRGVLTEVPIHDELFALADACAALLDAPVTIEDTASRVLAYSSRQDDADPVRVSTIVGRKVPAAVLASLRGRGVFRRLARSGDPFFVPADGELKPRLVIPVRAANEWLGSIWAVVEEQPDTETVRSLAQTASVVALHLLRLRTQTDLARRLAADRIRALLTGETVDTHAWLPEPPWRVVILAGDPGLDPESRAETWDSALRRGSWRQPLLAILDEQVVAIVRDADTTAPGTLGWLRSVVTRVAADNPGARACVGSPVRRPAELARSRQEALEVHRLALAGRLAGAVVTVHDAWAEVTCERAVSGIRAAVSPGPVGDLQRHDEAHGTAYAATLAAWLDHPGDPRAAAARVHVHPNTLRYRMAHLGDVVELDLTDPVTRLAARLELRALGH